MKKFEEAELEVMTFEGDVIATSGCPGNNPCAVYSPCSSDCDRDWG